MDLSIVFLFFPSLLGFTYFPASIKILNGIFFTIALIIYCLDSWLVMSSRQQH